ncbi:MAG TPA: GNAT family N-acetyltransferase [Roseiflexaceae bacterium]|nr:GNAT family N-acetyltransferase [Roseiflexaceae bacterium]
MSTSSSQPHDLQLMEIQAETLYRYDADGRMLCVNEPGDPQADRFFMGRTLQGNLWRFRYDLPAAIVEQLEALCRAEPVSAELASPPLHYQAIRAVLQSHAPIEGEYRGPAYRVPDNVQPPAGITLIAEANQELLERWFMDWLPVDPDQTVAAVVEEQAAVAVCFCSRLTDHAAEAGIETAAPFRRRGYAAAAVAGWAAEMRRRGRIALYSTSWDNLASQGVARRLGMRMYGEDWSIA